ncbi:flagellar basal body protein [Peribacillus frigoritolerans]|nr:flagellar basal body protein [Peribacillus frigoritolerans]
MNRTMMTATNTLNQLQSKIDQISNNIANVARQPSKRPKRVSMTY